jgi:signal transduction histidine kinase
MLRIRMNESNRKLRDFIAPTICADARKRRAEHRERNPVFRENAATGRRGAGDALLTARAGPTLLSYHRPIEGQAAAFTRLFEGPPAIRSGSTAIRPAAPEPLRALVRLARRGMLFTAAFSLAALAATGFALWQMRADHIGSSARQLAHLARGIAEETSREIADADQDLLRIVGAARIQPERLFDPDQRAAVMARNVSSITQASALAFLDADGALHVYAPRGAASPEFPRVAARDGLVVRDGFDREIPGLFLQRSLALRDGTRVGVLLLRFSQRHLAELMRAWRGEMPAMIALASPRGRALVQYPPGGEPGKPLPLLPALAAPAAAAGPPVRYSDPVDGRSYLLASERVPGTPLVVHAWIAERDVLSQWLSQSALLAGTTLGLVLIALALARKHATELGGRAAALARMQDLQNALAAEEKKLERIVRTVPSAVFQARVAARRTVSLTFMSAQIEPLWGLSPEEVLRQPRRALRRIARAHRRQLVEELSEAVLTGSGWDVTVPVQSARGILWMRIHAAPARRSADSAGTVWDGIISDVTEQKLAERQVVLLNLDLERRVEERTRELAELNRELEAFADSVSHDLRAPLRGIRSYADMLRARGELAGESANLLERVIAQGERMEELIEALLELSQLSRYDLRRTKVDLTAVATEVLQELAARDRERDVRWRVQPGLNAYADPRLMRVLFENLLGNAWKFTRERSDALIEVGADSRGDSTVYFVRDNGAGFDPQYAERLFRPFQRLHPTSRFEGTGIGLATVQRIVSRHGGRIWAVSTPGEGATFHFELAAESLYTRAP